MYSLFPTAMMRGLKSVPVVCETDISSGLPGLELVGFVSSEVKEAKERVRSALSNSGFSLPVKRITVNLSPASVRKSGTGFDLAIALSILLAGGQIDSPADTFFVTGELGLDGSLRPVSGVLPMLCDARERGLKRFIVPQDNKSEASLIPGAEVFFAKSLKDAVSILQGKTEKKNDNEACGNNQSEACFSAPLIHERKESPDTEDRVDFSDIRGQRMLKRACETAVSGMHSFLMVGPPGAGKTLAAKAMPGILPKVTEEEMLEIAEIYSVAGRFSEREGRLDERPFRAPHHTVSASALTGGGASRKPGELSLAHGGVLFLDELTEFKSSTLEVLRQPLEDGFIKTYYDGEEALYPADFVLCCAMNPCRCGYFPDRKRCRCTTAEIRHYMTKLSRPLLDRIDISVEVKPIAFSEATSSELPESSAEIRKRVTRTREIQRRRYRNETFSFNSGIPHTLLYKYCPLKKEDNDFMRENFERFGLSARAYHRILRTARTAADMEECEMIERRHLYEAICYRTIDSRFWEEVI